MDVGVVERTAHLLVDGNDRFNRQDVLGLYDFFKRLSLKDFHREVKQAIVLAEVVDGDDVGMRENSSRLGFALEPGFVFNEFRGPQTLGQHRLDCDHPTDDGIVGLVHDAHRPPAQF